MKYSALGILVLWACVACTEDSKTDTAKNTGSGNEASASRHPALTRPDLAKEKAPDVYKVRVETTKGPFVLEVHRDWAPHGADRFYNLVKIGFLDGNPFFRVVKTPQPFMVQFGISGDPKVAAAWANATFPDDPVRKSNRRGYITFARNSLPHSRSTQLFINFSDNTMLDPPQQKGFAPFGKVVEGMDVVDSLYSGYGEMKAMGNPGGVDTGRLQRDGIAYIKKSFPLMDRIVEARIVSE